MDLDCEMDIVFAKRLQKQQMLSPTSMLVSRQSKRRLESESDLENTAGSSGYRNEGTFLEPNKDSCIDIDTPAAAQIVAGGISKNSFCNVTVLQPNNDSFMEIDSKPATPQINTQTIEQFDTEGAISKNLFCDLNTKTPEKKVTQPKYEIDSYLRVKNRREDSCLGGDRYIPSRIGNNWQTDFSNTADGKPVVKPTMKLPDGSTEKVEAVPNENTIYSSVLRNELLGESIEEVKGYCKEFQAVSSPENKNLFRYASPVENDQNIETRSYSLSPIGTKSQKLLRSPCKTVRKISKIPYKVLDAPDLQNDFYLNLVDWSSQNMLSVGLGSCVYLWSACTSQVVRLCDFSSEGNSVTSVSWNDRGNHLAIGTFTGAVQIWDVAASKKVAQLTGHAARVGSSAWSGTVLSTGSRDKMILLRDIRMSNPTCTMYTGHRQEVCGLKWSPDGQNLASGGNDNRLYVWNRHSFTPIQTYTEHTAAVKAIAWSPHQHGLLASGGGTADRCIRFWNTLTGQPVQCVDTGSQVCNLAWSKFSSELVSTHGYSENQIALWKYPSLNQVATLTGHLTRVLYLAVSPEGESIVTGAGDETLRFWNVFSKTNAYKENKSVLNLFSSIR